MAHRGYVLLCGAERTEVRIHPTAEAAQAKADHLDTEGICPRPHRVARLV